MNTKAFYLGREFGFEACQSYATGDKQTRARLRRIFGRTAESFNPFWVGAFEGWQDAAEQRSAAIRSGLAPRSIRPGKLESFLARVG